MIQRLHLEEAQQPSAYAISAARESGEYREDKENESLALEFQSLLAQITGKLAAIPDQAMAVGLALAQTAAPQRLRPEQEIKVEDDSGERRDDVLQQDFQSQDSLQGGGLRQLQTRDQRADQDIEEASRRTAENGRSRQVDLSEDTGDYAIVEEQYIGEIESNLVEKVAQVVSGEQVAEEEPIEQIDISLGEEVAEEYIDSSNLLKQGQDTSEKVQIEDGGVALQREARVSVKQQKHEESEEEVEVEQSTSVAVESLDQNSDQTVHTRKNGSLGHKQKESGEDAPQHQKQEASSTPADIAARNQSSRNDPSAKRELQEFDLRSQGQRLSDEGNKGAKVRKDLDDRGLFDSSAEQFPRSSERSTDATLQMTMLRHSFDSLRLNRADGLDKAVKPQTPTVNPSGVTAETKPNQSEQSGRSSAKALPRPQVAKMLERVESTLKEAARSRDGRTISLHLEPVNLGKVKVDVSLREGTLHARISPENQQVVQALREHAYELQASLRKLGLDVETVSVSVTSDSFEGEMNTGQQSFDGSSFQDERNKMPHEAAQVVENTVGNELADWTTAGAEKQGSVTRNVLDHWVA